MDMREKYKSLSDSTDGYGVEDYLMKKPGKSIEEIEKHLRLPSEIYEDVRQEITTKEPTPKYPTGLRDLDEIVWGLHKKEIMAVGARTSMGKSAFALQITKNLIDTNKVVVYFSLEMSKEQLITRLMSNFVCLDGSDIRKGISDAELSPKDGVFRKWINEVPLIIDDEFGYQFTNVLEICTLIKPDFVVLDYIQMVRTESGQTKKDAIDNFLIDMKQLCKELDFGVILLSQLNREAEKDASLSTFKGSGVLEEHPDTCLILAWDIEKDTYMVHVKKQRHGAVASAQVRFKPEYSQFTDTMLTSVYEK